ncbi:MAG TPA: hypothetical protein VMI54_02700 [Polyangiaceae bacterium]|nr:hypothetical protein [Polyangiaceae bacterium]
MTSAGRRRFRLAAALVACTSTAGAVGAEPPPLPPAAPLDLAADAPCPDAGAVGDALREILGLGATERLREVARLAHTDTTLVVSLRDADGRALGERALPLEGSCDELARAAAVVLATWLSDVHPEFVPHLAQRANAATATNAPSAPSADPAHAPNAPHGARTEPAPSGLVLSRGALRPENDWRLRGAAAVGVSVLPVPVAFAGTLAVAFEPERGGIGATLRAGAESSRESAVPGGKVRYFRWPLEAGALVRLPARSVAFELDAGAALGWLHVAGRTFSPNRSANDVTFGGFAGARVLAARGRVQPFVELGGTFWIPSSRVYAEATQPSVVLPHAEMTLSLGATVVP